MRQHSGSVRFNSHFDTEHLSDIITLHIAYSGIQSENCVFECGQAKRHDTRISPFICE